ncbi:unnamed protein product [Closterium sp. NIES-54]
MASPSVLTFDAEGRAVDFNVWLDDLQLFLQCDSKDGLSLFDLTSGASTAPAADADSTVCSQWTTRDAAARLAVRSHLPSTERAHFSQYKSAKTLYDAVVARYSSPATAALSRLMLPYLFPDLAAFTTVADLITHLRTSDTRYRAALPAEFCAKNPPPMYITLYYLVTQLPDTLRSVRDHFLSLCLTTLTVDLLEERLLAAETSITAVGACRGDPRTPFFEGSGVAIFDLDFDAILAAMYAVSISAEGDCYVCVPPDPGIEAAALGASESAAPDAGGSALSGTASAQVLHTFTLDSGASRSFFRDCTTLTPLSRLVAVSQPDPSGGPVLAHYSNVLPLVLTTSTGAGGAAGVGADAGGAGVVPAGSGGAARPRPYFVPLLEQVLGLLPSSGPAPSLACPPPVQSESRIQLASPLPASSPYAGPTGGLAERREPESHPASPVRTARTSRRIPRSRPPAVPGTHQMALRPSTAPQCVPLLSPPRSSLPALANPASDSLRAASPTLTRFLATAITDPSFESAAAPALVAELVDFTAHCRLDYATSLVAESASVCPPSVGGECALSTDVLEDRQEEFQCFAAALPHLVSLLLAPEGDLDAPDIPTPRSYAEAIEGPYSSQWQAAMDAEMASWKSRGTYVDEVPPPGVNIVSGMWIFRVKQPPGSPPVFKARYVA